MSDHVLVWKQREKSIHFTRVGLWDSRHLLLYFYLLSSQIWGKGKDCEGLGDLPRKEWRGRVCEQLTYTATVKTSEAEPKPQNQFCFSVSWGIRASTSAAPAVRIISGTIHIPLYTMLYTQLSTVGLRDSTRAAPQPGNPSWVKNHSAHAP